MVGLEGELPRRRVPCNAPGCGQLQGTSTTGRVVCHACWYYLTEKWRRRNAD